MLAEGCEIDEELDASGLTCPLPLLKAKQLLNGMASGEVLKVTCTDPGSVRDFQVFCQQSCNQLLESRDDDDKFLYWVQKA